MLFLTGGWWAAQEFDDIHGNVAIEFTSMKYIHAMDNGNFCLGDMRDVGKYL